MSLVKRHILNLPLEVVQRYSTKVLATGEVARSHEFLDTHLRLRNLDVQALQGSRDEWV